MPRTPILSRTVFFAPMRGTLDSTTGEPMLRVLEWSAVDTEVGVCVEPRTPDQLMGTGMPLVQVDFVDSAASRFTLINSDTFQTQYGTGGPQVLGNY
jgi:hypothetical protein